MISEHAIIEPGASIGTGCNIWHWVHIREGVVIGEDVNIGANVYVDHDVMVGDYCKIGNGSLLYWPAQIGSGVFIGPQVMLINDKHPRAVDKLGRKLGPDDWKAEGVILEDYCNIGAGAIILPGIRIGKGAVIGSGTVVSKDVAPYTTVIGATQRSLL